MTELIQHYPEFTHFSQQIMTLARQFRLVEIKKILHSASEKPSSNEK